MIRTLLTVMTVCFSLHIMANDEPDNMPVSDWEEQDADNASEDSFNPANMFDDEEPESDDAQYNQFYSPGEAYYGGFEGDDSEFDDVYEEDDFSESDYYEED